MKVYLLNHPDFESRRIKITNRLNEENVDFEIIDKYSPSEIDYEYLTKDHTSYENIIIEQVGRYSYYNRPIKVSPGSLSLVLKHIHCWKNQIRENHENILILEDDCEIPNSFNKILERVLEEKIADNYDMVMLGGFSDFISPNTEQGKIIHHHPNQKTRCTHAYIINIKSSKIMIEGFSNINNPIDIKMNEVIQINKLKIAWLEPGLKQYNER